MDTLTPRLILALIIVAAGLIGYAVYYRLIIRQAQSKRLGLENARPGIPAILYFTTPSCAPCRTVQAPALERLMALYKGAVQVIKIDAQARPEVADHWGVLSVPTTFVIDPAGKPRFVNNGVTRAEKLQQQLLSISKWQVASSK
jgi:thioredoxin 1